MAITTTLQTKFTIRLVVIGIVSLVLGLWGVYDFFVRIPMLEAAYHKRVVYQHVHDAMVTTDGASGPTQIDAALTAVTEEYTAVVGRGAGEKPLDEISPEELARNLEAAGEMNWAAELQIFGAALREAKARPEGQPPSEPYAQTYELVKQRLGETSGVTEPGALDRITQIAFISCLLMVPWFMWQYHSTRRRVFRLEDDGSLAHPDGRFTKDEIKDVDMSRWMAKSVVWVEGPNGQRVKLDDYVYKNVDLIAGALASDRYPDEWDENARPVKKDEDGGQDGSNDTGTDTGTDDADDEGAEASRETAAGA